jgi:hypothetical protein
MSVARLVPASSGWAGARRPLGAAAAAAVGAIGVAVVDPYRHGALLPPCPFHALTGRWCPGCGSTRALASLVHGDLGAVVARNALFPAVLVLTAWAYLAWLGRASGWFALRGLPRSPWFTRVAFVVVVAFGVARNLPGPFTVLAP